MRERPQRARLQGPGLGHGSHRAQFSVDSTQDEVLMDSEDVVAVVAR